MEHSPKPSRHLAVEDLLRFKRHERPDDAFWAGFDHALHQRTLQSLVRFPWHHRLLHSAQQLLRPALIMPAAAAIALFTFFAAPQASIISVQTTPAVSSYSKAAFETPGPSASVQAPALAAESTPVTQTSDATLLPLRSLPVVYATDTLQSDRDHQGYQRLHASESLTAETEHLDYAASVYTVAQATYAVTPANVLY